MIEFVPLLLGLVSGPLTIEVKATVPVAQMELRLDGRSIATLVEEPWLFDYDLGPLAPHELEAVALDGAGREIDRIRQLINFKLNATEAAMVLSGGNRDQPRTVALVWEGIGQRQPLAVEMTLDGQPLVVDDPVSIPLPPTDPNEMHFLSATVRFRDETESKLHAGFGGGRGDEVATELTAVAVTLEKGIKLPRMDELAGWFLEDGEPLRVHGVEKGPAEVAVVCDPSLRPIFDELIEQVIDWQRRDPVRRLSAWGQIGNETYLRVFSPAVAPLSPTEVVPEMFAQSARLDATDEGLLWLAQTIRPKTFPWYFPDAVALAGNQAHASTGRRAVVLLLGDSPAVQGNYSPQEVREYLDALSVPLFVWQLDPVAEATWGEARTLSFSRGPRAGHKSLMSAVRELRANLDAQRIVWLKGRHLPQSIELAPRARGIRLAGTI